jgi:PAP2 superfamily protein
MKRLLISIVATAAGLLATPAALATPAEPARPAETASSTHPDTVVQWNRFLLSLQATPANQPPTVHPTYELALMHAAIYDAVVSIERNGKPYLVHVHAPRSASAVSAANAAAHDTLVALYPQLAAAIDAEYAQQLATIEPSRAKERGIAVGQASARALLAARRGDGSDAQPLPFEPGTQPGDYQLTPPGFANPVFTHWRFVRPFTLDSAGEFRPPAPPALTSPRYAAAINEVQRLGVAEGSTRTADQTQIGLFWNPPIWATWNRVAESAASARGVSLAADARVFAALNLAVADSVIALYDAKYTYAFWRPVTAIRAAGSDGNPDTIADPAWTPLSNTAPDPSYPGAHATVSATAATILTAAYGNDLDFAVDSAALPGVERSFTSFSEAAEEASVSRIYNGNHTRLDEVAGENLGRDVAGSVLDRFALRSHPAAEAGSHSTAR